MHSGCPHHRSQFTIGQPPTPPLSFTNPQSLADRIDAAALEVGGVGDPVRQQVVRHAILDLGLVRLRRANAGRHPGILDHGWRMAAIDFLGGEMLAFLAGHGLAKSA